MDDLSEYATRSIAASGLQRRMLGLRGFSWIAVVTAPILTMVATDSPPFALAVCLATYWFIKSCIDSKPPLWLIHTITFYITLPRHFAHRPKRVPVQQFNSSGED